MQERHHVKTYPGEPATPEIVPHAVHEEPGGHTQAEDINIPLLTLSVFFFAAFLVVVIVGLQAWFYNYSEAERAAKQVPQGAPGTVLGDLLAQHDRDLHAAPGWNDRLPGGEGKKIRRVPIDQAMQFTVTQYAQQNPATNRR
jgi:hypothetical protein